MNKQDQEKKAKDLEERLIRLVTNTINTSPNKREKYIKRIGELSRQYHELTGDLFVMKPRYRDKE